MADTFYFKLTAEGYTGDIDFQEVSGINTGDKIEEIENKYLHKLPKQVKHQNLVLRRGVFRESALFDWLKNSIESFSISPTRALLLLTLMDVNGNALVKWQFYNAYPVAVEVSEIDSQSGKIYIEKIEFAYDYFKR